MKLRLHVASVHHRVAPTHLRRNRLYTVEKGELDACATSRGRLKAEG